MMQKQQGSILIVALVMLLVLTIAGVSAMRLLTVETQAVGANLERNYAYQAAEAALIQAEQDVHQNFANFGAVEFVASAGECTTTNTCFVQDTCTNGLCSSGNYLDDIREHITDITTEPYAPKAYNVFPIGRTPDQIKKGIDDGVLKMADGSTPASPEAWTLEQLNEFQDEAPWQVESNWSSARTTSVRITVPKASGGFEQKAFNAKYLIEFRGFNLAPGSAVATANDLDFLPPSKSWMMTYRVTVQVESPDLDGARVMLQGLYTRQLPQTVESVVSVNDIFYNYSGSDVAIQYGCTKAELMANSANCTFPASMPPMLWGERDGPVSHWGNESGDTNDQLDVLFGADRGSDSALSAVADDEYFSSYFAGEDKATMLEEFKNNPTPNGSNPRYVKIEGNPAEFTCPDMTGNDVIVIDGNVIIDSPDHFFLKCQYDSDTKVIITGVLNIYENLGPPPSEPSLNPAGLVYVGGKDENGDELAPSTFQGSQVIYSMLAFESALRTTDSLNVYPKVNPFNSSVMARASERSRYAWRELDYID